PAERYTASMAFANPTPPRAPYATASPDGVGNTVTSLWRTPAWAASVSTGDVFRWTRSRTAANAKRVFTAPCATSKKSSSIHAESYNANMVIVRYLTQEMPTVIA
ncbi:hypothetical protein M9458_026005, partial [Cirrhinus mrigala]